MLLGRELALERRDSLTWRHPIAVSASFGLLHGFGFASALGEIGLPQTEIPAALLAFNLGVELGQVLFVGAILIVVKTASFALRRFQLERGVLLARLQVTLAYVVGSLTLLWTAQRVLTFWS